MTLQINDAVFKSLILNTFGNITIETSRSHKEQLLVLEIISQIDKLNFKDLTIFHDQIKKLKHNKEELRKITAHIHAILILGEIIACLENIHLQKCKEK